MCSTDCDSYLFADDAKLFRHVHDVSDSVLLQANCQAFYDWAERWLMKLNVEKCKTLSITRTNTPLHHKYGFVTSSDGFVALENVTHIKDLGITIDSNLSFDNHAYE